MIKRNSKIYLFFLLIFSSNFCLGQIQTDFVKPIQTDPDYGATEDSSAVSRNTSFQLNKLVLFIGGTNSSSSGTYNAIRLFSANLGFDFINLSYPNTVAAASLANDPDSLAFNKFRQEICFGTAVSDAVAVDSFNSIFTRTLKLLTYLEFTFPSENWGQYLIDENTINWSKIIVGGHSQGAGHSAFLAKTFSMDRVLMFAGPNDFSDFYENSANWLRQPGITPVTNHFVYLSLNDEIVDFSKQADCLANLGMFVNDDTTHVDILLLPYNNSNLLYTTQSPGVIILNHSVPIALTAINTDVWTYMLTSDLITNTNSFENDLSFSIYPNPTSSYLQIRSDQNLAQKRARLHDLSGRLIYTQILSDPNQNTIDLSKVKNGMYFLTIDQQTIKVVKVE